MKNVLFLCTGNSARSIMAEAYMNAAGAGAWRAWSAGSKPTGTQNPLALETLAAHDIDAALDEQAPRSKSWDEFARDDAPAMDAVVTVCDNAAGEICPVWPTRDGRAPLKLHWIFPDPAAVEGSREQKRAAFETVFADIRRSIDTFLKELR
jgi:arsenate reductase